MPSSPNLSQSIAARTQPSVSVDHYAIVPKDSQRHGGKSVPSVEVTYAPNVTRYTSGGVCYVETLGALLVLKSAPGLLSPSEGLAAAACLERAAADAASGVKAADHLEGLEDWGDLQRGEVYLVGNFTVVQMIDDGDLNFFVVLRGGGEVGRIYRDLTHPRAELPKGFTFEDDNGGCSPACPTMAEALSYLGDNGYTEVRADARALAECGLFR